MHHQPDWNSTVQHGRRGATSGRSTPSLGGIIAGAVLTAFGLLLAACSVLPFQGDETIWAVEGTPITRFAMPLLAVALVVAAGAIVATRYAVTATSALVFLGALFRWQTQLQIPKSEVFTHSTALAVLEQVRLVRSMPSSMRGARTASAYGGLALWLLGVGFLVGFAIWRLVTATLASREPGGTSETSGRRWFGIDVPVAALGLVCCVVAMATSLVQFAAQGRGISGTDYTGVANMSLGRLSGPALDQVLHAVAQVAALAAAAGVLSWRVERRRQVWLGASIAFFVWSVVVMLSRGSYGRPDVPFRVVYEPVATGLAVTVLSTVLLGVAAWAAWGSAAPPVTRTNSADGEVADEGPVRSSAP